LWQSQHDPLPSQLAALKQLFNEVEVIKNPLAFSSAEEIQKRFREGSFDDIVVVAPLSVIARLVDLGIKPLWAEMDQVPLNQAEVTAKVRGYRFNRFRRIKALHFEFEEIAPSDFKWFKGEK
jgi:hypothetical protein